MLVDGTDFGDGIGADKADVSVGSGAERDAGSHWLIRAARSAEDAVRRDATATPAPPCGAATGGPAFGGEGLCPLGVFKFLAVAIGAACGRTDGLATVSSLRQAARPARSSGLRRPLVSASTPCHNGPPSR